MKIWLVYFFSLLLSACSFNSPEPSGILGQEAPFARLYLLDGTPATVNQYSDKTVVLIFWAEWCSFSRPVVEKLNKLAKENKRPDIVYLAPSLDSNEKFERVSDFVKFQEIDQLKIAFSGNALLDEAFLAFHATALPHIFIIQKGTVVAEGHDAGVVEDTLGL